MKRLLLAFFTPLNPQRSGISDYSEELLPYLAEKADIEIVIGPYQPSNKEILRRFPVIQSEQFSKDPNRYDSVIYQIGNNATYHGYMIPCMQTVPGVAVFHDCCLSYLVLGVTVFNGNLRWLKGMLSEAYGRPMNALARELLFSRIDPYEISLASPFIKLSKAVIVHSRYALEQLRQDNPGKKWRVIPMGVPIYEPDKSSADLKAEYGFGKKDFILLSMGSLAYNKRLQLLLDTLQNLFARFPGLKYVIVGGGTPDPLGRKSLKKWISLGKVLRTGWVSADQYRDYILMADLVVDLRYPSAGETSASILRAMAAGKPCIVSAHGSFSELPGSNTVKIAVNHSEKENLEGAIGSLIEDEDKRLRMGQSAKEFVRSNHQLEQAARSYIEFLEEVNCLPNSGSIEDGFINDRPLGIEKMAISTIYKIFRILYLRRQYGWIETLKRMYSRLHSNNLTEW